MRGRKWEASWPHSTAGPDRTSQIPTEFQGGTHPISLSPRRCSTGQVSGCAHVSSSFMVHLTRTEQICLGLQLLRDREQLKTHPWPLSSAKRAAPAAPCSLADMQQKPQLAQNLRPSGIWAVMAEEPQMVTQAQAQFEAHLEPGDNRKQLI